MRGQTNKYILQGKFPRVLRGSMTDAELGLWRFLRRKQMANFKFRRQHPFGDYILDFVCFEAKLVIEVDGNQHAPSSAHDEQRTRYLERQGFRVLRFWDNDVLRDTEAVKELVWHVLQTPPPSQPSP